METATRKMKSLRLSQATHAALELAAKVMGERDGVRDVTQTEVMERAIAEYLQNHGIQTTTE